ncbi:DUF4345 domain-containing protein [Modestobacter sp. SYSU DS0290]
MTPATTVRAIRGVLLALGAVASGTGTLVAARGASAIPGGAPTTAGVESVLRFYAVWWAAQGPRAWRLARDPQLDAGELRSICGTTVVGGVARLAAMRASGRPHPLFQALTVAELTLPPVLIALRGRLPEHGGAGAGEVLHR